MSKPQVLAGALAHITTMAGCKKMKHCSTRETLAKLLATSILIAAVHLCMAMGFSPSWLQIGGFALALYKLRVYLSG